MGEHRIKTTSDEASRHAFMKALLEEVHALELMIDKGMIESGIRRIGAEQEMFLVDKARRPAMKSTDVLNHLTDDRFTHELGRFNMEANLSPYELGGDCLSQMEAELRTLLHQAQSGAQARECDIALVGILPTIRKSDLTLDAMVPKPRYFALNDALLNLRGKEFNFTINGIDQLSTTHDNLMLEACNTSFQVHFQLDADEFARLYNIAQAVTGPLLAACCNSPILLGKRLWHETRIAVFEQSVDARSETHKTRGLKPRVHFGDHWIEDSVIEIFKEDIARFRVILTTETEDDPVGMVESGEIPSLNALRLHNGTVYRWNRPCFGVNNGVAHLRLENRVIPAGPTVLDEMANAAFFFGLLSGLATEVDDIRNHIEFEEVKANFLAAARDGLKAQQTWFDDRHLPAQQLIMDHLLPLAEAGLAASDIDRADSERYLDVIAGRVKANQTGSRWLLKSYSKLNGQCSDDERLRTITDAMVKSQHTDDPVHEWPLAELDGSQDWRDSYRSVSHFMATDLFTVRPDDIVDFAATLMDWRHVRHVPVEDDDGCLVGLVSHRELLRLVARGRTVTETDTKVTVADIMIADPPTIAPETRTLDALKLMREAQVACLPVVEEGKLVGLVTEHDFIALSARVLEHYLDD